jgi:6-phosphogluconolactonase
MEIIQGRDSNNLIKIATKILLNKMIDCYNLKGSINFGLVGGRSVSELYGELSKQPFDNWANVQFFLVDERNVPLNSELSNYSVVNNGLLRSLLDKQLITEDNIHLVNTDLSPILAIENYVSFLEKYGGTLDVVVLSAGEEGHVAGIFQDISYSDNKLVYFENSPKLPAKRFSITPDLLSKTKTAVVLYFGDSKEKALRSLLNEHTEKTLPERTLYKIKDLIIVTDRDIV